jgi:hypothetical protein
MTRSKLAIAAAAAAIAATANATPAALTGVWGGDQSILTLRADGGRLESGCAQGEITGPVRVDAKGRFRAKGQFQSFRPGPQREDEAPALRVAFTGRVDGDTMDLAIRGGGSDRHLILKRDVRPRLVRCL